MSTAVILLAYGAPETLDEVPGFLRLVRGGAPVSAELVQEFTSRYREIGNGSPLLPITRRLADKLAHRVDMPVYIAMRHWSPFIADVAAQMAADGVRHVKAICLTPHFSDLSVGAYRRALEEAIAACGWPMTLDFCESWEDNAAYVSGAAHLVNLTLDRFEPDARDEVVIAFTAHSLPRSVSRDLPRSVSRDLPQRGIDMQDPYPQQLMTTCQLVSQELGLADSRWFLAYQSAGHSGGEWLGPSIEQRLLELAATGCRHLLVAPIGFVCDNLEILYDIDIALQRQASSHNIHLERTPMLNDSDWMVSALASLVFGPGAS